MTQGYEVKDIILYQDNLSAVLLANNGKGSSRKRTRHLDVRFFFIKDRVGNGEVWLEYKTTTDLTADYFSKPSQGKAFRLFRDRVMGL